MLRSAINCRPMIQPGKQKGAVNIRCASEGVSWLIDIIMSICPFGGDGRMGSFAAESADPGISFV